VIADAAAVSTGDEIRVRLSRGRVDAKVTATANDGESS